MTVRYPDQITISQRIIFWLGREEGWVALGHPTRRFSWEDASDGPVVHCRPRQLATMLRRGLAREECGKLHLSERAMRCAAGLKRPPKGTSETRVSASRFWLDSEQIAAVRRYFPTSGPKGARVAERERLSGIVEALRGDIPFTWLDRDYGAPARIDRMFRRWARSGALDEVFSALVEESDGVVRHVVSAPMLWRHRRAAAYAASGCFPIMAPIEEMPA